MDCNGNLLRIQSNVKGCLKRNQRLFRHDPSNMILILTYQQSNKICVYLPILIWHRNFFRCLQDALAIGTVVFDPATIQVLPLSCEIFGAGNFIKLFPTGINCPKHVNAIMIILHRDQVPYELYIPSKSISTTTELTFAYLIP